MLEVDRVEFYLRENSNADFVTILIFEMFIINTHHDVVSSYHNILMQSGYN